MSLKMFATLDGSRDGKVRSFSISVHIADLRYDLLPAMARILSQKT
jgi:hypothetical protein